MPTNNKQIEQAINFANQKFTQKGIKNHFPEVFNIMKTELNILDQDILIAGILHDTLEDTNTTYDEIANIFNQKIADLVKEVSHPKNYNQEQRIEYY